MADSSNKPDGDITRSSAHRVARWLQYRRVLYEERTRRIEAPSAYRPISRHRAGPQIIATGRRPAVSFDAGNEAGLRWAQFSPRSRSYARVMV